MAVGEDRQHGGNDGYDDEPDAHYTWDSTVPNHSSLQVGDPIALWDKKWLLGVSTIEEIDTGFDEKLLRRCRQCGLAGIKSRKTRSPRYKCYKCKAEFDTAISKVQLVKTYRSRHDAGWRRLPGVLSGSELRELCISPKSQLSLRPLRWKALQQQIMSRIGRNVAGLMDRRLPLTGSAGGHVLATVRVRLGQHAFRQRLFSRWGSRCAFTGPAPAAALEAGHLYSYADLGVHHEHGGLLLRRDVHRLFDDGELAVDPKTLTIDVGERLQSFDQYAMLHESRLTIDLDEAQVSWLAKHWQQHRSQLMKRRA
jgi:hypothetical protein